jgi:hypothetical protein
VTPLDVRTAIERSWTSTTTFSPEGWADRDPAWGQCGVTAVLLADLYAGELRRGTALLPDGWTTTHYWAVIDGVDTDLTWRQFPVGTRLEDLAVIDRSVILANRWMVDRYAELLANFTREREGRPVAPWGGFRGGASEPVLASCTQCGATA